MFRAQTLLVHEWRRLPFLDPELPGDMLPARWPRGRAHALFHERHAAWDDTRARVVRDARARRRGVRRRAHRRLRSRRR